MAARPATVAVLHFVNRDDTGLCDWLSFGLPETYEHGLRQHPAFTPVDRSKLDAIRDEINLDCFTAPSSNLIARAGRLLKAEWVLYGQFLNEESRLTVEVRLVSLKKEQTLAHHRFTVPRDEILTAVPDSIHNLVGQLGDTPNPELGDLAFPTRSFTAFEAMQRAREIADVHDDEEALRLLLEARRSDPNYLQARYQLAATYRHLDQPHLADLESIALASHSNCLTMSQAQIQSIALRMGAIGQFRLHDHLMEFVFRKSFFRQEPNQELLEKFGAEDSRYSLPDRAVYADLSKQQDLFNKTILNHTRCLPPGLPGVNYLLPNGRTPEGEVHLWNVRGNIIPEKRFYRSLFAAPPGKLIAAVGHQKG